MKYVSVFVVLLLAEYVHGQTNSDLRAVNGKIYDANTSSNWVSIVIPAGARLGNSEEIHFTGNIKPENIMFLLPPFELGGMPFRGYPLYIQNFPYNPLLFRQYGYFIYLTTSLKIRVFQSGRFTTNYDSLGRMTISKPSAFDFGTPASAITNSTSFESNSNKPISIVTPRVLRIVDGKEYDIHSSRLWGSPIGGPLVDDDTGHSIRYETIPQDIQDGKTFCEMYAIQSWYDYFGNPKDEDRWFVKEIVIYNAPTNLILGKPYQFTCMKVSDFIKGNRFICEAYDCGIESTNKPQ